MATSENCLAVYLNDHEAEVAVGATLSCQ